MVVFRLLEIKQVQAILDLQINELSQRLAEQGYSIRVAQAARKILIEKGWDPKFGVRPLRRALQKELEDPLSFKILSGDYPSGTVFSAVGKGGKIYLRAEDEKLLEAPVVSDAVAVEQEAGGTS